MEAAFARTSSSLRTDDFCTYRSLVLIVLRDDTRRDCEVATVSNYSFTRFDAGIILRELQRSQRADLSQAWETIAKGGFCTMNSPL